ncbi:hypothetical protein HYH03_000103 [Edaphochlamys debaryana]|uniref:Uncharacterized protein n=1 Tax=Edaphochlamys debaryana TaxID=47281 RepID=A0A836C6W5_9CHLO|nr:hypothetical protein HYH03_000103 [Edaphochlamys debaryana]|eukprot:KAG2501598.1 hypothetical protein HYH03_000103 [Edaphochlamys debaryana]
MASSLSWSDSILVECCENTDDSCKLAPSADDTPTLMADLGLALLRVALAQTLDRRSSADSPVLRAQALVQASVCGSAYQSCVASAASSCASFSSCRSDSALPSAPIPVPSPSQQACRRRSDPGAVAAAQPFLDLPCPGEGVEAVGRRDPAQNPILVAVRDYYEAYRRQRETAPPHKPPKPCRRVVGFEL